MSENIKKTTLVSSTTDPVEIVSERNEDHMKFIFRGITLSNFLGERGETDYSKLSEIQIHIPLWAIPYLMRQQREAVAKYEKSELEKLNRLKKAYNTEV